jgi:hypothetical protein
MSAVDRGDDVDVLGDCQKPIRRQQAVLTMLPAGEGFYAGDIERARIELRLIEGNEFVARGRSEYRRPSACWR